MLNKVACANTFTGITGLTTNGSTADIPAIKNSDDVIVYTVDAAGTQTMKTYRITEMKAIRTGSTGLDIRVMLEKSRLGASGGNKSFGASRKSIKIAVDALYGPLGVVTKCYSQMDNAVTSARDEACKDVDPAASWNESTGCQLSVTFKKNIVEDGLAQMTSIDLYRKADNTLTTAATEYSHTDTTPRNCSKCSKSGCNPGACPSGWARSGRTCNKGGLCGFKPRWRNCSVTCSIIRYKNTTSIGKVYP